MRCPVSHSPHHSLLPTQHSRHVAGAIAHCGHTVCLSDIQPRSSIYVTSWGPLGMSVHPPIFQNTQSKSSFLEAEWLTCLKLCSLGLPLLVKLLRGPWPSRKPMDARASVFSVHAERGSDPRRVNSSISPRKTETDALCAERQLPGTLIHTQLERALGRLPVGVG